MNLIRSGVLLALAFNASANDLSGTWKASFVGRIEDRPKMVSEMTFEFKVDGDKLSGMAHMANWPGDAPISEGKIDGDQISFTAVGKLPWTASGPNWKSGGYPKLNFVGKIDGKGVKITLTWESVMIYGADTSHPRIYEMQGKKIANSK